MPNHPVECTKCGCCCDAIPDFTKSRLKGRKDKSPGALFILKHWRRISIERARGRGLQIDPKDGAFRKVASRAYYECEYFDRESRLCSIHDRKPEMCSRFPFYEGDDTINPLVRDWPNCVYGENWDESITQIERRLLEDKRIIQMGIDAQD
jgi:Fe-S-cluster containining protein